MRGVFSVGGRLSLMVIRKTVMESRAEIPRVTWREQEGEEGGAVGRGVGGAVE